LLGLRAAGVTAIGVDITPSATSVAMSDLAGRVLARVELPRTVEREKLVQLIVEQVRQFRQWTGQGTIEGIGISLPGLVDPDSGRAIYIPYFKWRDWPIAQEISQATGLEVTIDNDANAAALAALWFGHPEISDARDFIMVLVTEGVGTGIIFDGQIYRGERGAAGEFGHMIIGAGTDAPIPCSCGSRDCWEAFASGRAAVARYTLKTQESAVEALTETAHYLGIGISNLIVGLSPEAVIVGGPIARAWPLVDDALTETIYRSIRRGLPSAQIVPSILGDQPTLIGAISLVLARKFALKNMA
jgi:predicted NBD/HSP70 family sugar kinase